jgi:hypothetical protein
MKFFLYSTGLDDEIALIELLVVLTVKLEWRICEELNGVWRGFVESLAEI